jgi:hypothetical protein
MLASILARGQVGLTSRISLGRRTASSEVLDEAIEVANGILPVTISEGARAFRPTSQREAAPLKNH